MLKFPTSGTCCHPPRWGSERHGIAETNDDTKSAARKTPPWTGPCFFLSMNYCFHLFEIEKQENDSKTSVLLSSMSYKRKNTWNLTRKPNAISVGHEVLTTLNPGSVSTLSSGRSARPIGIQRQKSNSQQVWFEMILYTSIKVWN